MRHGRLAALGIAAVLGLAGCSAGRNLPLSASLPVGEHAVGFRVVRTSDTSRGFGATSSPRPIQISLWYPASKAGAPPSMRFQEYLGDIPTEGAADSAGVDMSRGRAEYIAYFESLGASGEVMRKLMTVPTLARRDAPIASGRFPVVLLAVGLSESPVQHSILAECLASHGYVVASVPSMGAERREMEFSAASLDHHVRDLECVVDWLRGQPFADLERTAAVGYSFGGGSVVLLEMKRADLGAIVSLDGSIGFGDRLATYEACSFFSLDRQCAPLLHVNVEGLARNDLRLLKSPRCGTHWVLSVHDAEHLDFSDAGMIAGTFRDFRTSLWGFEKSRRPRRAYQTMFRHVLAFLDANLRKDETSERMFSDPERVRGADIQRFTP